MDALGSAQGAVDSLLGTLASVIKDEARLLGNVKGDVQFICDEMESMNGFLLHVSESSEDDDHQVRAWMKQVRDVAVQSERWVQRYQRWASTAPRSVGLLGCVGRIPHSLWTISERHEIAAKIKELKARAYEVGERRHRYGVVVPPKKEPPVEDPQAGSGGGDETEEQQHARRCCLVDPRVPDMTEEDESNLIRWLTADGRDIPQLRIIRTGSNSFKNKVFDDDSVATRFDGRIWFTVSRGRHRACNGVMDYLIGHLEDCYGQLQDDTDGLETSECVSRILAGKRFLLVLDGLNSNKEWLQLERVLESCGCSDGSAVIIITRDLTLQMSSCYRSLDKVEEIVAVYRDKAIALVQEPSKSEKVQVLNHIVTKLSSDLFCSKMLLQLLYVKPNRTLEQLEGLCVNLRDGEEWINAHQMLLFGYNDLPTDYRSCLLYLSVYPKGWRIRRTCLLSRWVAEGLITSRPGLAAPDAAVRCFDALLDRGLLRCLHMGDAGNAKFIAVPEQVFQFIAEIAKAENFAVLNLPPSLAPYVSINNGIQLQHAQEEWQRRDYCFTILRSIFSNCKHSVPEEKADPIVALLASLPSFEREGLLKVLDLESCRGFQKKHMKNICRISELRYLNLRGTDITKLPSEIHVLQNLETLDIRETEITVLPTKIIFLRKIKHLLVGDGTGGGVRMPDGICNMTKMQILSNVEISDNDPYKLLDDLGQLQKLRKLGVVLVGHKASYFQSVLNAVEKLDKSLRSFSVWNKSWAEAQRTDHGGPNMMIIPRFLQSIKMYGFDRGLPQFALRSNQLVKVTMEKTSLWEDDLKRLGKLPSLRCLRLRSIKWRWLNGELDLVIQKDGFQNLKFLIFEGPELSGLSFEQGAAIKLEIMEWSDGFVNRLSGIIHLTRLDKICFYGSNLSDQVKGTIAENPRSINVSYSLSDVNQQGLEGGREPEDEESL